VAGLLLISVLVSLIALILGAISDSGLGTAALVISIINILVGGFLILLLAAAVLVFYPSYFLIGIVHPDFTWTNFLSHNSYYVK
jgi:hypothetical protein